MSTILADGPPEPKKFRIDVPVDASLSPPADATQPLAGEAPQEGQSPAAPSSARSSNGSIVSSGSNDKEDDVDVGMTGNLLEMISKSLLGQMTPFKMEDVGHQMPPSLSPSPKPTTPNMVPGAVAVAQSPAAQLFAEIGRLQDDWSWHRNPAASIRSGGTNKQTPVWKYFVYNKAENLSRCIVGDCTYMLKGPHTSTLACHLKKHPVEYSEFQKLKVDYTRERHGGQMPPSPSSSTSTMSSGVPQPAKPPPQPKKKESRPDVNSIMNSLRQSQPTSPMPNLVHNLLGMNPLQFMMNQQVPTSTANISAAQATSQMLQQAGLTLTPSGQIIPSKKWRRDERRQRELESRLAIAFAASHIPSEVLSSSLWKELFEVAQPKFTFPDDTSIIEQLVVSHHARLLQTIKSHINSSKKICLTVEGIKVPCQNHEELQRILVSASFPGYSGQKYEIQQVVLALRPLATGESAAESITLTVDQILSDYEIPMEKISKVVCLGLQGLQGFEGDNLFDRQIDSFCDRLLSAFTFFLENSQAVDDLKKSIFAMIFAFVAKSDALQALNKATGGVVELPFTEHFIILAEAVLKIKDAMQHIVAQGIVPNNVTEQQWILLRAVCHAASLVKQAASGEIATIDGAIPALRQLIKSLETEPTLAPVSEELKRTIEDQLDSILDVNSPSFDGTFVLSTALNPQLAVLLSEEQLAYAKKTLEKQLRSRMPARPHGVDALLANVISQTKLNGTDLSANPLYADLFQQAHDRIQQEKNPSRDRMAEAVVSTYFEEILNGCGVDALLSPFGGNRSFGHPFQPPLLFWQQASASYPQLADLATELLCIPQSPPAASRLLSLRSRDTPWHQPDASLLLAHLDKPDRLERDLLLRANRSFLPKTY